MERCFSLQQCLYHRVNEHPIRELNHIVTPDSETMLLANSCTFMVYTLNWPVQSVYYALS